jgi:hypothetical protein
MAEWHKISQREWDALPPPTSKKRESVWKDVLDELKEGEIIALVVPEGKLNGWRIGLARGAASLNMKLEFRQSGEQLIVRKSGQPYERKEKEEAPTVVKARRGRRPKQASEK